MRCGKATITALALLPGLLACGSLKNRPVNSTSKTPRWIVALSDGHTTREKVEAAAGSPSRNFESGRIVVYRLDHRYRNMQAWPPRFEVVLVFDDDDVLEHHRLVRFR